MIVPSSLSDFPAAAWQASRYTGAINFDGSVPMSNFCAITRDIGFLLPPSVQDWLPEGHLARYVVEVVEVVEGLDLSELERA